jgi:hypothetical protein
MSIGLRVIMLLACAYAGWETAGVHSVELPELQQQAQYDSADLNRR